MGGERSVSPADMRFNHSRDHPGVSDSVNTDCELKQDVCEITEQLLIYLATKKPETLKYKASGLLRAGDERIELPPKVLETPIIPFDQSPTSLS